VVVVENGEDAVKMASQEKFDIILMDMQMPIMNGFEATEKIREMTEYRETPIVALTAFAMKGDREKCLEAGATDYIPKPIDSKEFIDKVKYYTKYTRINLLQVPLSKTWRDYRISHQQPIIIFFIFTSVKIQLENK